MSNFVINSHNFAIPFSPDDISDLICWYNSSEGITKNGSDLVSQWNNFEATSGRDLVQATASDKPTFLADGGSTSGNPAVDFTGGSLMRIDYGESFDQPYTICSACYVPANDSNERILFDGGETGATTVCGCRNAAQCRASGDPA